MTATRRESDKTEWIRFAADVLLNHLRPDGRIEITDTQYPETHLYLGGDLFPLLEAYATSKDQKYLDGARKVLDYFSANQLPSGGWTFGCLAEGGERTTTVGGYGTYREMADKVCAHSPPWPMAAVRMYERLTGDEAYRSLVIRAVSFLECIWDDQWGFHDGVVTAIFKDKLAIAGLSQWRDVNPKADMLFRRTIDFVTRSPRCWNGRDRTWWADVGGDKPAPAAGVAAMCCALLETTGTRFVDSHIEPAIGRVLARNEYNCPHDPDLLSYWPLREDRADIRSNAYLLLAMKLLDVVTGTTRYRQSPRYQRIASWLATMRDDQGFLEYENCGDGSRGSHASPAQFLVCFWVAGRFLW